MKKKGSVLVVMLIIISLLLVLSVSVITTATSTTKTTYSADKINRTNLAAQSGITQGIAVLKSYTPPNVPLAIRTNILDDSGLANPNNYAQITFSYNNNAYTITSTAKYSNYSKTVTQLITINTQNNNSGFPASLFNYTLGIINPSNSSNYSLNFKSQGAAVSLTFNGLIYMYGNPNNFTSDTKASITINNGIATNQQPGIVAAQDNNGNGNGNGGNKGIVINGDNTSVSQGNSIDFPQIINIPIGTNKIISVNGYTIKVINGDYTVQTSDMNGREIIFCSGGVHFNKSSGNSFNGLNIYSNGIYVEDNGNYSLTITGNNFSDTDKNNISGALSSYIK